MKIKIVDSNHKIMFINHDINNPWNEFIRTFINTGNDIQSTNSNEKFELLIANSHSWKYILQCMLRKIPKKRRILIIWESKATNKGIYRSIVKNRYGKIFSPSKNWMTGENISYFNWPQLPVRKMSTTEKSWEDRSSEVIMIAANKFSIQPGEMYSLRREILSDKEIAHYIHLAGSGWNENAIKNKIRVIKRIVRSKKIFFDSKHIRNSNPNIVNYLGIIDKKSEILQKYKITLVIENSLDYVSEKLFDALDSENVVIYVGGNLEDFDLPEKLAIQIPDSKNIIAKKLKELKNIDVKELIQIQKEQQKLYFEICENWNNKKVLSDLAKQIISYISD
jgi:hypothetical protein